MGFSPLFAASLFPGNPHPPRCAVMLATQSAGEGGNGTARHGWRAVSFRPMVAGQASSAGIVASEHARDQLAGIITPPLGVTRRALLEPQPQRRHAAFTAALASSSSASAGVSG